MSMFFIHFRANSNDAGPFTLKYNPKWLAILKSTNHLQSSSYNNQHMPGKGYAYGRCDFTPTPEEEKIVRKIFNEEFDIPENFVKTTKVFNASCENTKQIFSIQDPKPQVNRRADYLSKMPTKNDDFFQLSAVKKTSFLLAISPK